MMKDKNIDRATNYPDIKIIQLRKETGISLTLRQKIIVLLHLIQIRINKMVTTQ
jgi:hypothetical protein